MTSRLEVRMEQDRIYVGERFSMTLQRTLRLPEDGKEYPLPPGFGSFRLDSVESLGAVAPPVWKATGGFIAPIYEREALWFQFSAARWKPNAVQVAVGGINAISGGPLREGLAADPQNYVVCPGQPWLDGINSGEGTIRQFVATATGLGDTIGEQLSGQAASALQVRVYDPRPGHFPDIGPAESDTAMSMFAEGAGEPGIGAGGAMTQKIYPDPYGLEIWDEKSFGVVHVFLVSPGRYRALIGKVPPPSPISAWLNLTRWICSWMRCPTSSSRQWTSMSGQLRAPGAAPTLNSLSPKGSDGLAARPWWLPSAAAPTSFMAGLPLPPRSGCGTAT
jgi:hypothetical protein